MSRYLITTCLLIITTGLKVYGQKEADEVIGLWLTADQDAKIKVYKCGNKYCGKLFWIKEPLEENGEPKRDDENPEPSLRNRLLEGLEIMSEFVYDEDYEWEDGKIYDPKSGSTYSCLMELSEDKRTLEVRGYIGISLFGRTEKWSKIAE